jgi:hypothetical protein
MYSFRRENVHLLYSNEQDFYPRLNEWHNELNINRGMTINLVDGVWTGRPRNRCSNSDVQEIFLFLTFGLMSPAGLGPETDALARSSSSYKRQTRSLVKEDTHINKPATVWQ